MPNALSIFTSESQLGLIDFEMALDVEEQAQRDYIYVAHSSLIKARISEQKRFSLDTARGKNGLDFQIYKESESYSGVEAEEISSPASQLVTEDSPGHTYYTHNPPDAIDTQFALQLPLSAKVSDDRYNQSQPSEGDIYAQTQTRTNPLSNDYSNHHPEDQENNIQQQSLSPASSSSSSSTNHHNSYSPPNPTRTHRRFDSTESYTTHWDNTLLNNKAWNAFTFQTRSRYKSPYLGPVGWTVPSRYTSITRTRVMMKPAVTKRRTTGKRGVVGGLNTMVETAAGAGPSPSDLDGNDEEGYAGDVDDAEAGEGGDGDNDDGGDGSGSSKVMRQGRSRVVCRRCESRPFLIYQDPEWLDVSGMDVDPFINAAASDDKENVDPNGGRGGNGDEDGDVEMVG